MTISFSKYIDITSGVGGTSNVGQRSLCGRIFSSNDLIPTNTVIEFTNIADIGTYFGTASEEYRRAANPYFSFISKNIKTPQLISYYFASPAAATAPLILGDKSLKSVIPFQFISNGALSLTLGGVTNIMTGMDFTATLTLADVAAVVQTAIRANSGTMWTAATVTYDPIRGSFNFLGGVSGAANVIPSTASTGTEIVNLLGWLTPIGNGSGTIVSDGIDLLTITEILDQSSNLSDNFGSFVFTIVIDLNLPQVTEAAQWNDLQNITYKFMVPVLPVNTASWSSVLLPYSGTSMTLVPDTLVSEFQEMADMTILAATDYNSRNATQNYMYQTNFTFTPTVTDTSTSNAMDALRINYWGITQRAGTTISFYQRGVLTGGSTSPQDSNTYANEQWFKSAAGSALMSLLLTLPKVSANSQGIAQVLSVLQSVVDLALTNGTISVGKTLNQIQQLFISSITGDSTGRDWQQVQNIGYWIGAQIIETSPVEFELQYTLIYSKDDVIRTIKGSDILI